MPSEHMERLERLEAIEAIRRLKARYFNACDAKDLGTLRTCFAADAVEIDYGHVGRFQHVDDFVALFDAAGNHPHILDMHHGANADIELVSRHHATARWSFDYRNINTEAETITLASGFYDDAYVFVDAGWRISASRVTYVSAVHLAYENDSIRQVFTGESVAGVVAYER